MRVCVVSRATAQHFKRGSRLPSPQAQRLWWLHIQGRILPLDWKRFRVRNDLLFDAAGNSYQEGEIAAIPFLRQQVSELKFQLDKRRYAEKLGDLGFFELPNLLRRVLHDSETLLAAIEKIPRRSPTDPPRHEPAFINKIEFK